MNHSLEENNILEEKNNLAENNSLAENKKSKNKKKADYIVPIVCLLLLLLIMIFHTRLYVLVLFAIGALFYIATKRKIRNKEKMTVLFALYLIVALPFVGVIGFLYTSMVDTISGTRSPFEYRKEIAEKKENFANDDYNPFGIFPEKIPLGTLWVTYKNGYLRYSLKMKASEKYLQEEMTKWKELETPIQEDYTVDFGPNQGMRKLPETNDKNKLSTDENPVNMRAFLMRDPGNESYEGFWVDLTQKEIMYFRTYDH